MMRCALFVCLAFGLASAGSDWPECGSIDPVVVSGLLNGDTVIAGTEVRWNLHITNDCGGKVTGSTNGFVVWTHRNGVCTDNFSPITYDTIDAFDWKVKYDLLVSIGPFSVDGIGKDTVKFGGCALSGPGIADGTDFEAAWTIATTPSEDGDTLCLDSSWYPPGNPWIWSVLGLGTRQPNWDGPFCYHVACCEGDQGNVDLHNGTTVADLTMLVKYVFPPHDSLICSGVGNVDGQEIMGSKVNVADVTYLVAYLFLGGPPPAACEEE